MSSLSLVYFMDFPTLEYYSFKLNVFFFFLNGTAILVSPCHCGKDIVGEIYDPLEFNEKRIRKAHFD